MQKKNEKCKTGKCNKKLNNTIILKILCKIYINFNPFAFSIKHKRAKICRLKLTIKYNVIIIIIFFLLGVESQ